MAPEFGNNMKHGTRGKYVSGCRCRMCRYANRKAHRDRQKQLKELTKGFSRPWKKGRTLLGRLKDGSKVWVTMRPHCRGPSDLDGTCGRALRKDRRLPVCTRCEALLKWNGFVLAAPARKYMRYLSSKGIGRRTVSDLAKVSDTVLTKIRNGKKKMIRLDTLERILAVPDDFITDATLVDGKKTRELIDDLRKRVNMSAKAIVEAMGYSGNGIQFARRGKVTAKTEARMVRFHKKVLTDLESDPGVLKKEMNRMIRAILKEGTTRRQLAKRLGWHNLDFKTYKGCASSVLGKELRQAYEEITGDFADAGGGDDVCADCGMSHTPEARRTWLRKQLPESTFVLRSRRPCTYPGNSAGAWALLRDLKALGAIESKEPGEFGMVWVLPEATPAPSSAQGLEP